MFRKLGQYKIQISVQVEMVVYLAYQDIHYEARESDGGHKPLDKLGVSVLVIV